MYAAMEVATVCEPETGVQPSIVLMLLPLGAAIPAIGKRARSGWPSGQAAWTVTSGFAPDPVASARGMPDPAFAGRERKGELPCVR